MNTAAADEHDITGAQSIALALHIIAALTGYQKQYLAELVIVKIHLFPDAGTQMEQPEIFQQISPFFIFCHGCPSDFGYYRQYSICCPSSATEKAHYLHTFWQDCEGVSTSCMI